MKLPRVLLAAVLLCSVALTTARAADVAISIPLGVSVFYVAAKWLRTAELEAAASALATPPTMFAPA